MEEPKQKKLCIDQQFIKIDANLFNKDLLKGLKEEWSTMLNREQTTIKPNNQLTSKEANLMRSEKVQLISYPFKACYIDGFLKAPTSQQQLQNEGTPAENMNLQLDEPVDILKKDLIQEAFYHKSNDLYEFLQSEDLKCSKSKFVREFRDEIYSNKFVEFMSELTGIELTTERIDLSSHRYPPGGHLLCHDDDIGDAEDQLDGKESFGRRIAFILYLVDADWGEDIEEGGHLQLFDSDQNGHPNEIVVSTPPKRNRFAFFEVSPSSHHQVQEVLGKRERMSISGWLHGPLPKRHFFKETGTAHENTYVADNNSSDKKASHKNVNTGKINQHDDSVNQELNEKNENQEHFDLGQWMNSVYLTEQSISKMSQVFLDTSSIELQDFLKPEVYALLESFKTCQEKHILEKLLVGPPNARLYNKYSITTCNSSKKEQKEQNESMKLIQLLAFFKSKTFKSFLEQITSLKLNSQLFREEIKEYEAGQYQLLHDQYSEPFGLDMTFFLLQKKCQEFDKSWGGWTHYVADSETLLSLQPKPNTLCLVLRDEGTLRFVKYVNHQCKQSRREIEFIWKEVAEDEHELDHSTR